MAAPGVPQRKPILALLVLVTLAAVVVLLVGGHLGWALVAALIGGVALVAGARPQGE